MVIKLIWCSRRSLWLSEENVFNKPEKQNQDYKPRVILEPRYLSQNYSNLIWTLWFYPIQSPQRDFSDFRGCFFLHLFAFQLLQLQGPPWFCLISRGVWIPGTSLASKTIIIPVNFVNFEDCHGEEWYLLEWQVPHPSAEASLNALFLLSSFLPLRTNNHLLRPDLETVPSTFTCLRGRSNTFTSQKVFWWIILSPFRYRNNLRKVFICFASSRSFVVVESEWGLYFCWIVKKPILFLYRGKDLGSGGGGMRWSVDFSSHQ